MKPARSSRRAAATIFALTLLTLPAGADARPPNVVLVVADDLGYSDLGSYGGEIATPHLDRLALQGIRFSRFYATPRCSPSRAALLTGVWPHEAGVGHLARDWGRPAYRGAIREDVPTIAERLRGAGYATYMVGKWHLTPEPTHTEDEPPTSWPLQRGFDRFYGTLGGSGSYFEPPHLYHQSRPATLDAGNGAGADRDGGDGPRPKPRAGYLTDELGERARAYVAEHLDNAPQQPFFLYLAFTAPHWPLHAPPADVERYRGRFDAGWDELRAARFDRQRALGLVGQEARLPPRDPRVEPWAASPHREWQARRMEVYAAMVSAMDRATGRVIAELEERGALADTIVVFLSDNGACGEEFRGPYRLAPVFVPIPERTAGGLPVRFGDDPSIEPGPADTFATYGRSWAHLSNTPLRLYKHWTHEGGISVPFFVHWPAGLGDRAGAIVHAPSHVVDVVPTLLEVASTGGAGRVGAGGGESGLTPKAGSGATARGDSDVAPGRAASPVDLRGASLWPILRGEPVAGSRTFYWEHEGNRAILEGDTKLVSRWPGSWELYDLAADRSELEDLATAQPARVAELERLWNRWAAGVGVEPWPLVVPQVRTAIGAAAMVLLVLFSLRRLLRGRADSRRRPPGTRPPSGEDRAPAAQPAPSRPIDGMPPPIRPR